MTVNHYDLAGQLIAESDDADNIRRQPLSYTDTITLIEGKGKTQTVSEQTVLYYLHETIVSICLAECQQ